MKRTKYLWLIISLFCCSTLMAQTKKDITVNVTNIPTKTGRILVATGNQKHYGMVEVSDSQVQVILKALPFGKYQLNVFHDANSNWQLDKENDVPIEHCATMNIEVTESTELISVELINVKEIVNVHK